MHIPPAPKEYAYQYPPELIATEPAHPREAARLLVYSRQTKHITITTFADIGSYLPQGAVLVFNETKVLPARFYVTRPTGGRVELLSLGVQRGGVHVLANRQLRVGETLAAPGTSVQFAVTEKLEKGYIVCPNLPLEEFEQFLLQVGTTPIPPYIKHTTLTEARLREEYQSVLAKRAGSSAAPTASLHFSEPLLSRLAASGVTIERVTLHVGLGTFAPLTETQLQTARLHTEWYEIDPETADRLRGYKRAGRPIIAVGTTVVRTLESAARSGELRDLSGETDLFIYPPYTFQYVTGLVTNFHVPESSLLMLVAAFSGKEALFQLYERAITERFRLFSFGDGMLIV